jgi:uncharacterized protein YwgA
MERLRRAVVLLTLLEHLQKHGSWCGETHIQKTTYFLQELLRVPLGFDFTLYKHGPYSFDLSDELTALQADQLLAMVIRDPQYGPALLPGPTSQTFLKGYPKTRAGVAREVQFVADRLAQKNVVELERLGTALFVTLNPRASAAAEARAAEITRLKPHITPEQARTAVRLIDQMVAEWEHLKAQEEGD